MKRSVLVTSSSLRLPFLLSPPLSVGGFSGGHYGAAGLDSLRLHLGRIRSRLLH